MAANKKCHHSLANKEITDFIVNIFQCQFHAKYSVKAEVDAHNKTIKNILHLFARLTNGSSIGQTILAHSFIPIFSQLQKSSVPTTEDMPDTTFANDLSAICKMLNDSMSHSILSRDKEECTSGKRSEKKLLESYV